MINLRGGLEGAVERCFAQAAFSFPSESLASVSRIVGILARRSNSKSIKVGTIGRYTALDQRHILVHADVKKICYCMGSFADGLPATRPTTWADVTNATKSWGQRLSENKTPILFSVFLLLVYFAVQPLLRDQFFFADVFWARLLLTSASLALVPIFVSPLLSRFNLRFFQINRGPGGPWFPWRKILAYLVAIIVVGGLGYLMDPLGAYAQARTKAVVNIFYVTDRRPEATANGQLIFSALPNDQRQSADQQVSYGMGRIALSWSRSDVLRNLRSKVPLVRNPEAANLQTVTSEDFYTTVDSYRAPYAHESFGQPDVLIFIHGFDNSFDGGTQAAAKLGFDLKFDGPVIAYSWPSKGEPTPIAYSYDGEQSYWSRKHFESLLITLAGNSNHRRIHVIAHSMGNRVLLESVSELSPKQPIFENVIMAAADMNDANFGQDSPAIITSAHRVTLYVSGWDQALNLSRVGNASPRIGEEVICRPRIDVVDTQGLGASPLTLLHSYVYESDLVLDDMSALIRHGEPPDRRVHVIQNDDHCTWRLQPR